MAMDGCDQAQWWGILERHHEEGWIVSRGCSWDYAEAHHVATTIQSSDTTTTSLLVYSFMVSWDWHIHVKAMNVSLGRHGKALCMIFIDCVSTQQWFDLKEYNERGLRLQEINPLLRQYSTHHLLQRAWYDSFCKRWPPTCSHMGGMTIWWCRSICIGYSESHGEYFTLGTYFLLGKAIQGSAGVSVTVSRDTSKCCLLIHVIDDSKITWIHLFFFCAGHVGKNAIHGYSQRAIHPVQEISHRRLYWTTIYIREAITSAIPHVIRTSHAYKKARFLDLMCMFRRSGAPQLLSHLHAPEMLEVVRSQEPWSDPVRFANHFRHMLEFFVAGEKICRGYGNQVNGIRELFWAMELQARGITTCSCTFMDWNGYRAVDDWTYYHNCSVQVQMDCEILLYVTRYTAAQRIVKLHQDQGIGLVRVTENGHCGCLMPVLTVM